MANIKVETRSHPHAGKTFAIQKNAIHTLTPRRHWLDVSCIANCQRFDSYV